MKTLFLAFFAFIAVNLSAQTTDLQYQAHVPTATTQESKFSAYIADGSFNENSHINTTAFWYVEEQSITVNNGMINVLLEDISDTVFTKHQGNIFVYAYVNGVSLGKLALHKVPYAVSSRFSARSEFANNSAMAEKATHAINSRYADTSTFSLRSQASRLADSSVKSAHSVRSSIADSSVNSKHSAHSLLADTSIIALESIYAKVSGYSANSGRADIADTAFYSINSGHAVYSDTSLYARNAGHSATSDTSLYARNAGHSATSSIASDLQDSVIVAKHITNGAVKLNALDGGNGATIGSYAMRGASGLIWAVNPHHFTTLVDLYTVAPASLSNTSRYIVSRVAVDYNMVALSNPIMGQLLTVHNGSTANVVTLKGLVWNIDTLLDIVIFAGQSRTLWYTGTNWMVIQ